MFAYVFWHQPAKAGDSEYEKDLTQFHRQLARHAPPGFIDSHAFWLEDCPWMRGACYEDWYLIDTLPALGPLNEGAVAGDVRQVHDVVAARAGAGAGGMYRLRHGVATFGDDVAYWFDKLPGMNYASLDELVQRGGGWCWQRQLALGPTPEFCAEAAPQKIAGARRVRRARLF